MSDNVIRQHRQRGFTQVPNQTLNDAELSLKAKGLLAILLQFQDGWTFYMADLVRRSKDGKDSLLSARRELEEERYVVVQEGRGEAGRFRGLTWHVSDVPFNPDEYALLTEEDFPRRSSRDGEPSSSNTQVSKTQTNLFTGAEEHEEERDQPPLPPRSSSTSHRQKFAIQASQEKSARKKLEEMLGERYKFAQTLVNKNGMKADTLYQRLSASPHLLSTFLSTENDVFEATLERAKEQAARHPSGWESNVGAQFLSLLGQHHKPGDLSRQQGGGGLVDQSWTISDRMYAGQLRRGIAHYGGLLERGEPSPSMDLTQMASHVAYLKQELVELEGKYANQSGQSAEKE